MKKAIVTGANGFVGSALCKALSENGTEVIAVVRSNTSDIKEIEHLPNLKMVYCPLEEIKELPTMIEDNDIDAMYHLAWEGTSGPLRGDDAVQLKNIQHTCDAVRACADMKCSRFVFASSIMEYEIKATMETDRVPGINTLYCSAKLSADYFARTIAGTLGVEYLRAVISNAYGPLEKSARLINSTIRKLLKNEHCSFSAGEQMYDFIYITDAAKSFVAIGEKGISNRTYYIGSQNPKPLKEFLLELRDQIDPEIELGLGELPFNGISLGYDEFNISAIKNDTGFVPEITFDEGVRKTAEWIRESG